MKALIKVSLFAFLVTIFTACGGGMTKNNLVGKKWSLDADALEKEIERVVSNLGDGFIVEQIKKGIKESFEEDRASIESGTMEFKEDGSVIVSGTERSSFASSADDTKWSLEGGKLYFSKDDVKFGMRISGSADKMTFTITTADIKEFFEEQGEALPLGTAGILDKIGSINISLKTK